MRKESLVLTRLERLAIVRFIHIAIQTEKFLGEFDLERLFIWPHSFPDAARIYTS